MLLETHNDSGQLKVGRCQRFSGELEKKGMSAKDREVQVRATVAGEDITDRERRRRNTSICVSCDASPLYPCQEKKMGTVADEWPRSQEENRAELSSGD